MFSAKYFLALSFLFSLSTIVHSQTITWTGFGDGLNWSDKDNWSTGFLPANTDEVLIENDSVVLDHISAEVVRLELRNVAFTILEPFFITSDTFGILCENSSLYLLNKITIDEAEIGIDLKNSRFLNHGNLQILSTFRYGFRSDATSIIRNQGKMEILDSDWIGIISNGLLVNHDTIIIQDDCSFYGLQTRDSVLNTSTGFIHLSNFPTGAPTALRLENLNARLTNDGEIWIENLNYTGVQVWGVLVNNNLINISGTLNSGIEVLDTLHNNDGATITIDNVALNGLSPGFKDEGYVANHGQIELTNSYAGFRFNGYFENFDTILISNIQSVGFQVFDTLHMYSDAVILGANIGSTPSWCFENRFWYSFLRIEGKVRIDDCSMGLENKGHFEVTATGSFELSGISHEYLENPEEAVFICDGSFVLLN